ncbi:L,D-peptidoglycan transpeptidase YkuD (ErfK/YbiS/YcfS/YnhG family) [Streptacidiphilus sp. MAP5-52]
MPRPSAFVRIVMRAATRVATAAVTSAAVACGSLLAAAPAQASPAAPHFPVPVRLGGADQVITVQAHGSYATVTAWQWTRGGWRVVVRSTAARIGARGVVNGTTRVQGSYQTPTGTFSITQGFGNGPNPGTRMPYHHVTAHDWWVEDRASRYYNRMRTDTLGGFRLTEAGVDGSEHLADYPVQYHNVLVINFNTDPAVRGRGAGIFLHDLSTSGGPTAGCVAVPSGVLTTIMRWIAPAGHPVIAIG